MMVRASSIMIGGCRRAGYTMMVVSWSMMRKWMKKKKTNIAN